MSRPQPSPWNNEPPQKPGGNGGCFWTLMFMGGVVLLVAGLMAIYPGRMERGDNWLNLVYVVVLLMAIALSVGSAFRANATRTIRHIAIWIGIAGSIAVLYSFRQEFGDIADRVAANFQPSKGYEEPDGKRVSFFADESGHFFIEAEVEGRMIEFLVDTGASDVVLSPDDARKLRYDPQDLTYSQRYNTANGTVRGAPVTLEGIGIGPIYVRNVQASINESPMDVSLLGMSFLGRLRGYSVNGDRLTLEQ